MPPLTTDKTQPAIFGGLVMGVLSALPIVSAGNLCCCLWVVSGGVVAAYVLQQNQATPITQGDGALVGLLAGLVGAGVYLVLSIPITLLVAPMERLALQRIVELGGGMPPEFRDFATSYMGGSIRLTLGFIMMLVLGSIFSTIGGLVGAMIFRKPLPPGTIDVTPPPAS
jgi:hypothetical protein